MLQAEENSSVSMHSKSSTLMPITPTAKPWNLSMVSLCPPPSPPLTRTHGHVVDKRACLVVTQRVGNLVNIEAAADNHALQHLQHTATHGHQQLVKLSGVGSAFYPGSFSCPSAEAVRRCPLKGISAFLHTSSSAPPLRFLRW